MTIAATTTNYDDIICPVGQGVMRHPVRILTHLPENCPESSLTVDSRTENSSTRQPCTHSCEGQGHVFDLSQIVEYWKTNMNSWGREENCPLCRREFVALQTVGAGELNDLVGRIAQYMEENIQNPDADSYVEPPQFFRINGNAIEEAMRNNHGILTRDMLGRFIPGYTPRSRRNEVEDLFEMNWLENIRERMSIGDNESCENPGRICVMLTVAATAIFCAFKAIASFFRCIFCLD